MRAEGWLLKVVWRLIKQPASWSEGFGVGARSGEAKAGPNRQEMTLKVKGWEKAVMCDV
jgi:hypothetical protein